VARLFFYLTCRIILCRWNETEVQADAMAHVTQLVEAGFPLDTLIFDMQ
jgi:hypothetical protein